MIPPDAFTIADVLPILGGRLICGDPKLRFRSYCIDSRQVSPGTLFVPLMGQNRDGHQYVTDSLAKGAMGTVLRSGHHQVHEIVNWVRERERQGEDYALIEVRHTLVALQKLSEWYRQQYPAKVVGITGSVGKTGTKEILIQLLARRMNTVGTEKNFNNEIGVPLALSKIGPDTEIAVIEMAMRARGEISLLSRIAHPDAALITSTAGSHVGRLGSFDEVYKAKAEILDGMNGGPLVLNRRDPNIISLVAESLRRARKEPELKFYDTSALFLNAGLPPFVPPGIEEPDVTELPEADVWVEDFQMLGLGGSSFTLCTPDQRQPVRLNLLGRGSAENLVAAAALGLQVGLRLEDIGEDSQQLLPAPQRLSLLRPADDLIIIDDSYNSSPASARDSLELLLSVDPRYRKIAVFGDMLELGKYETLLHRQLAQMVLTSPLNAVYAVGSRMNAVNEVEARDDIDLHYIEGSSLNGGSDHNRRRREQASELAILEDEAAQRLGEMLIEDVEQREQPTVVLIKGSRGLHLERVINQMLERIETA